MEINLKHNFLLIAILLDLLQFYAVSHLYFINYQHVSVTNKHRVKWEYQEMHLKKLQIDMHCVKSVRILSFSGVYFPAFGLTLRIHSECGKIRTRKTPNMDTFHVVKIFKVGKFQENILGKYKTHVKLISFCSFVTEKLKCKEITFLAFYVNLGQGNFLS